VSTQLSLLPSRRFWVVTLAWPDGSRVTCAPPGGFTQRKAQEFAAKHEWPQSAFVIPVVDPADLGTQKTVPRQP
jgi:hypothetical protein